ncbi:MAG: cysteine hydrolase [Proteobacteria bacterium]|nr:cysteine hydrolase [Pseudomonadota bacterium]
MKSLAKQTALIIIDVQKGFNDPVWGRRNNPHAEQNIAALLTAWRETGRPIFHVQHLSRDPTSPLRPDQSGCEIKDLVRPAAGEPVIQKEVNSGFIGTDLEDQLRQETIETVVVTGLTTNHCVSTTVRMAANLGFDTHVVSDATAAFDRDGPDGRQYPAEQIHDISLANLHGEFATVLATEDVLGLLDD